MNLKLLEVLADQKKSWFCILLTLTSCNLTVEEKQESSKSISQMSQEVCQCFSKQKTGDIDAKMTPCINLVTSPQTATLKEGHSPQDSTTAVDAMVANEKYKISEVTNNLVISCDAFGSEMEALYDKWYPVDSSTSNLTTIEQLSSRFQNATASDTTYKGILHKLIAKNIEARRLEEGLKRCKQMKALYKGEEGAYYASAFIYQLQKKYPLAINELEQEIAIYNKPDLKLIVGIIKRKAQRNKTLVN